ncbi:Hcp family type VI secretion system effector [Roseateles chitosanitabidus]|jgi:type VI secretion system secreted protein Hcp|uniref:Hcp family type VI secretion system effector n=1 Tax=Roseateles chitosanitabidus TaxID=65048 RepID=UPI00083134B6|nr:type VI secretion system tube protein Hcp [Roseateles chitosanitabidus]MBO9688270.1 type VI secretion system tube protein Hcp [Roseateles chitosanitabidus]
MNPLTSGGASSADMYLDLSLKRAGKVKGESTSAGHANDIVVIGFSWGVGAAGDAVAGQQTGRRSYRQLTISKHLDSASTALMSAVATNDEVKSAKLYLRKAGGSQEDYFCLTLEKARVASYDIEADADGSPVERIAMSFQKVAVEYRTQSAKGAMGGTTTFDDDLT